MSPCAPLRSACAMSVVVLLSGCLATEDNESLVHDGAEVIHNKLSVEESSDGWELLFDGVSLEQWRGYGRDDIPETWIAQDGEMMLQTAGGNMDGGDIITKAEFRDFELVFALEIVYTIPNLCEKHNNLVGQRRVRDKIRC